MWKDIFEYKEGCLYWKIKPSSKSKIGDKAGYLLNNGYLMVQYNYKPYLLHRLIWEYFNGPIPEGWEVDHINHVKDDNRIENLRIVTRKENCKNRSKNCNNSSGITGVSWDSVRFKWRAYINVDGDQKLLGFFDSLQEAINKRSQANIDHNYHANHGGS